MLHDIQLVQNVVRSLQSMGTIVFVFESRKTKYDEKSTTLQINIENVKKKNDIDRALVNRAI